MENNKYLYKPLLGLIAGVLCFTFIYVQASHGKSPMMKLYSLLDLKWSIISLNENTTTGFDVSAANLDVGREVKTQDGKLMPEAGNTKMIDTATTMANDSVCPYPDPVVVPVQNMNKPAGKISGKRNCKPKTVAPPKRVIPKSGPKKKSWEY